jgi:hypothetical protein
VLERWRLSNNRAEKGIFVDKGVRHSQILAIGSKTAPGATLVSLLAATTSVCW